MGLPAQKDNPLRTMLAAVPWIASVVLACIACTLFYFALNHPISADLGMLHYSAWLMNEQHAVLYRDIFEINFPVPFLFHQFLGKVIGYDAGALRAVDLILFGTLSYISWKILKPVSRASAVAAPGLFSVFYWVNGGEFILEREFIGLIPASAAFLVAVSSKKSPLFCSLITGALAGLAISIKPNFFVMLPALFVILWHRQYLASKALHYSGKPVERNKAWQLLAAMILTSACVSLAPFLWIYYKGGMDNFVHIYKTFLPIYTRCRYDLWHYDSDAERRAMLLSNFLKFAKLSFSFAIPGLVWAWLCNASNTLARQRILYLAAMVFAFVWYELIAGKFWLSHLLPTIYWSALGFSLLLSPVIPPDSNQASGTHPTWKFVVSIAAVGIFSYYSYRFSSLSLPQMIAAHETANTSVSRSQKIADYLKTHLQPNETVQVMDMATDGQAALLLARAPTASRHLIDVPLYMEPDSADTQALRQELIDTLQKKPAAYIVYIQNFLHPGGGNRLQEFTALKQIIDADYEVALDSGDSFVIYHRLQK
jgi:hypothetical protein